MSELRVWVTLHYQQWELAGLRWRAANVAICTMKEPRAAANWLKPAGKMVSMVGFEN